MEEKVFISECIRLFELNSLPCSELEAKKLYSLTERMLEVNRTMNLTAIKEEKAVILRHYVDSLTVSEHIPSGAEIIDIGCGAGFPTLPLAIFRPDIRITALDGTAKRINYVSATAEMLGLSNVRAIAGRAEEFAFEPKYRERFDIVTARAVASLPVLCELCLPFARVGGQMIAMKGQQGDVELSEALRCIELCGGKSNRIIQKDITEDGENVESRSLIFIDKVINTPKIYPRHFSKISKKHL